MDMIPIMVPFFNVDVVGWRDSGKYPQKTFGNLVINDIPAVFYYQNQVVVH